MKTVSSGNIGVKNSGKQNDSSFVKIMALIDLAFSENRLTP